MSVSNINVRVDSDVKKKAEKVFNELGINMTTAFNMFLRASIRENGLPFELKLKNPYLLDFDEISDEELNKSINEGLRDFEEGRFYTAEELDEELHREYGI